MLCFLLSDSLLIAIVQLAGGCGLRSAVHCDARVPGQGRTQEGDTCVMISRSRRCHELVTSWRWWSPCWGSSGPRPSTAATASWPGAPRGRSGSRRWSTCWSRTSSPSSVRPTLILIECNLVCSAQSRAPLSVPDNCVCVCRRAAGGHLCWALQRGGEREEGGRAVARGGRLHPALLLPGESVACHVCHHACHTCHE